MSVSLSSLHRIIALNLSAEQLRVVFEVLTDELKPLEAFREASAERARRYRSYGAAPITPSLRSEVYKRDGHICAYCGSGQDLTCDHVTPVSKGGQTTLENLVTACRPCNSRKKDRERKRDGRSVETTGTTAGQRPETAPSRVLDNISKPSLEVVSKKESITSDSFPQDPPGFKDFWAIYPPRAGDRDRKPATKAFSAALKRIDLKTLLWATERYAADCKAKGKINTEYVKQARTWLNADGWKETYQSAGNGQSDAFSSTRDFLQRIGRA